MKLNNIQRNEPYLVPTLLRGNEYVLCDSCGPNQALIPNSMQVCVTTQERGNEIKAGFEMMLQKSQKE